MDLRRRVWNLLPLATCCRPRLAQLVLSATPDPADSSSCCMEVGMTPLAGSSLAPSICHFPNLMLPLLGFPISLSLIQNVGNHGPIRMPNKRTWMWRWLPSVGSRSPPRSPTSTVCTAAATCMQLSPISISVSLDIVEFMLLVLTISPIRPNFSNQTIEKWTNSLAVTLRHPLSPT